MMSGPGVGPSREAPLKLVAFLPIAGFGVLAALAAIVASDPSLWQGNAVPGIWPLGVVLWASLGGLLLALLVAALAAPRRFGHWAPPPWAVVAVSAANLGIAAVGVVLGQLAGFGKFPGVVVDAIVLLIATLGLLVCGIAWTGTEARRGWREWLARGLALANGGIGFALAVLLFLSVTNPPVR